jgi:hypothetical protein
MGFVKLIVTLSITNVMRTNLVIGTYAGKYSPVNKTNKLKTTLSILNRINTNITQITIMKPRVNPEHEEDFDYYNFSSIDISNIQHKIKIIECENIGISYGQFFTAIRHNMEFDYHFFIEDDITVFMDYFENYMINELHQVPNDAYLCLFYFRSKKTNLLNTIQNEHPNTQRIFFDKMVQYNLESKFTVPDNSVGAISKQSIAKILNRFNGFDNILHIFNINFHNIWIHQVLFGWIFHESGIEIHDISEKNVNMFYHTGKEVTMCNFDGDLHKWKERLYNNEKLDIPVFVPIEIFHPFDQTDLFLHLKKYFIDYDNFVNKYRLLNEVALNKVVITTHP